MKILIVEDSKNDRNLLKLNLEHQGCDVIEAEDGEQGLAAARAHQPDLIISDALMPKMDGFELLKEAKEDPALCAIPFIFYSAVYTGKKEEELALALGAEAFVVKPLEPNALWQRIQDILQAQDRTAQQRLPSEYNQFFKPYSRIVATKLEEKVRELEKEKDRWERTFNAITDIITIQDENHRIIRANKATAEAFGMSTQEIIGKFCHELFRDSATPCHGCPITESLKDFKGHFAEISHPGLEKIFLVSATPLREEDGQFSGIMHFAKDITRQRKMETQLRQNQKMEAIGTLAGGIAHDFNNILTAVLGYAELAQFRMKPEKLPHDELAEIIKAGNRAKELVKQILTFSRQTEHEAHPMRIQHIIKEALKLLRPSLPTSIEIKEQIDPDCGTIMADPTQIHQVIMNLCTNAYHAMQANGGVMVITLGQIVIGSDDALLLSDLIPGDYLKLSISDSGSGMSQEILGKIFDPYFTTKATGKGTGLGLAVVHGIITNLHGSIRAYSEEGVGTTFNVYFPVLATEAATDTLKPKEIPLPCGSEKIMTVDDESTIGELQKAILENLGYHVTVFSDSPSALAAFTANPAAFDLIITDMTMPKMNGSELAREILKLRADIPIILCTGFSDIMDEEQAKALGIKEYIMKPILTYDLAQAVRAALDKTKP